jgi:hypothetical protein
MVAFGLAAISIPIVFGLTWVASPLITITATHLRVGKVSIERIHLGTVGVIASADTFSERGVKLDSRAYTKFQIGIKELVKIEIVDELDPAPYWLVATRNPEVIAGLLNRG